MIAPHVYQILIATGNPGKAREIQAVLNPVFERGSPSPDASTLERIEGDVSLTASSRSGRVQDVPIVTWKSLADLRAMIPEPDETGATFEENAALKARYYSHASGLWTLADDSGLEVDALDGRPGVRSARFAEGLPDDATRAQRDAANNEKLISLLKGVAAERRTARFRCALALADGDRLLATAQGVIEGVIIDAPRGTHGFGYDPHFLIPSLNQTTAELDPAHKNAISHRGQALRALCDQLRGLLAGKI